VTAPTAAPAETEVRREEYPFQCGAAYAIAAETFRLAGKTKEAERYREKFKALSGDAEEAFLERSHSKADAEAYMQKHVNDLAVLAERDARLVISFVQRCDSLFPEL